MRGESARPGKRPLRALSASEKMDAIQRVHEGESKASVARDIGVPESTLRGWCKSEHKIRGMARNSSTPDSEAHSPASSSGANNSATPGGLGCGGGNIASGSANLSSEDEGGPPTIKRSKLDRSQGTPGSNSTGGSSFVADCDGELKQDKPKIDYVGLMTSMAAGMRPENSSLLLQQLGLLSGATGTLAKNLLGMSPGLTTHGAAAAVAAAAAAAAAAGSPVGLVENGLQYTKSSGNVSTLSNANSGASNGKRHGISAIAPTQMDSVVAKSSCARKSLPPAAEAPSTPVPASPRKTNENGAMRSGNSTKSKRDGVSGSGTGNKKIDEALWLWLTQQQQLLGQQSATFNPSINQHDGSWFWQWYKQCSFPLITPTPVTPSPVATKKSPSKARALLDNVLCNNNNENVKRSLNMDEAAQDEEGQSQQQQQQQQQQLVMSTGSGNGDVPGSTEEAIEHGEKFFKWLDKCSEPAVTRLQIMQFKYLLDNLKACRKKSSSLKQSRK